MKTALFSFLFLFLVVNSLQAQDTIIVQTLTYDSTGRSYMFDFPEDNGQNYEKIQMLYSMRCKGAKVSTGTDRNLGCGEWDYSCNTFITDSTLTDSVKVTHPSHKISGFNGDKFFFTSDTVFTFYQFKQYKVSTDSIISESSYTIGNGLEELNYPFNLSSKTSKSQYLFTSEELIHAGLKPGEISGLNMNLLSSEGKIDFLRVNIKHVNNIELNESNPDLNGFTEVYFKNTFLIPGLNRLNFYQHFDWDGISNLLVEFSYTNSYKENDLMIAGQNMDKNVALNSISDDYFLNFSGVGKMFINNTDFSSIDNEVTISFWAFGNPDKMPTNSTAFEGYDENNRRQVNAHLPWSNSNIYWDCGNENNSYDRINKLAISEEIKGKWNHWTLTKNTSTGYLKIYLNGELWHSGTDKTKNISIDKLSIGGSINNNYSYYGFIDDFSIWNKDLNAEVIKEYMFKTINENHPNYSNLIAHFKLNETEGNIFNDSSPQNKSANHTGVTSHKYLRGNNMFKGFKTSSLRPNITFHQGEYEQVIEEITVVDSVQNDLYTIYYYDVVGSDLVLVDSINTYQAGYSYIYNAETNNLLDSIYYFPQDSINITTLDYYNKLPSKFELLSFVTPYGIGLDLGENGKTWQFDVTDFKPILNGKKRLSIEFGKYQEELDIKFLFIKGTPPRNINKIQQLWKSGTGRSYSNLINDRFFESRIVSLDNSSSMYKIRTAITGHGQEGEFIGRNHFININGGEKEFNWKVWKECADNPIYPQGGTWIYDRAGWCPGAPTDLMEMEITDIVNSSNQVEIDYGLNTASGDSRYIINCQLVSYGTPNFNLDAAIFEIQKPSQRTEFQRFNPICFDPVVIIQNTGSSDLKSLDIEYYVKGGIKKTYNWTGNLEFLEKEKVTLPIENTSFWLGDGSNTFIATVKNPNNGIDEYNQNNKLQSKFTLPDILQSEFILVLQTNNKPHENTLKITKHDGEVIVLKDNLINNHKYQENLNLSEGCYELEFTDSGDDGLSFWALPSQGGGDLYFRKKNFIRIKNFDSDFGKSIKYNFLIGEINKIDDKIISDDIFDVHPNPTSGKTTISFNIKPKSISKIIISDITGREIMSINGRDIINEEFTIDFNRFKPGVYFINYKENNISVTKKVVVQK